MARVPVVRQISWSALLVYVLVVGGVVAASGWLSGSTKVMQATLLAMVCCSLGGRMWLTREHRRAMRLVKQQQWAAAIPHFEASYVFFTRKVWVDRYRAITMGSQSAIGYREMALVNIAFCYSQSGEGLRAKQAFQRALAEFPESGLASTALRMIEATEQAVRGEAVAIAQ